jgi:REP element-mobilizing transposase RayT
MMETVLTKYDISCFAYSQMPNHVHLILQDPHEDLSRTIHALHGGYARYINDHYGHVGHLFQDRFYSQACESESQLMAWIRYVHLNAPRAGLVHLPQDYPWSSMKAYLGGGSPSIVDVESILRHLSDDAVMQRKAFLAFTLEGLTHKQFILDSLMMDAKAGLVECSRELLWQLTPVLMEMLDMPPPKIVDGVIEIPTKEMRNQLIRRLYRFGIFSMDELAIGYNIGKTTVKRILG